MKKMILALFASLVLAAGITACKPASDSNTASDDNTTVTNGDTTYDVVNGDDANTDTNSVDSE